MCVIQNLPAQKSDPRLGWIQNSILLTPIRFLSILTRTKWKWIARWTTFRVVDKMARGECDRAGCVRRWGTPGGGSRANRIAVTTLPARRALPRRGSRALPYCLCVPCLDHPPLTNRTSQPGPKKHLKRLTAPYHWMLDKLTGRYVRSPRCPSLAFIVNLVGWPACLLFSRCQLRQCRVWQPRGGGWTHGAFTHGSLAPLQAPRPSTGPHKLRECLPLVVLLRNRLKSVGLPACRSLAALSSLRRSVLRGT